MKKINIPLEKLIASKDIIAQCKKEKRVFTPFEQAVLIYQNPKLAHEEMLNLLKQIQDAVKDEEEYKELYQQLEERISYQQNLLKKFYSKEEGQYFCFLYEDSKTHKLWEGKYYRCFSTLEKQLNYVDEYFENYCRETESERPNFNGEFIVEKHYLDQDLKDDLDIIAVYNSDKEIINISSSVLEPVTWEQKDNFVNAFIEIPYPFRNGDIVHTIGESEISIFSSCKDSKEYKKNKAFHQKLLKEGCVFDTSDISCRVEALCKDYEKPKIMTFYHKHPSLLTLEYAELPKNKYGGLLFAAQELMKGKGSLEDFCYYLNLENK